MAFDRKCPSPLSQALVSYFADDLWPKNAKRDSLVVRDLGKFVST